MQVLTSALMGFLFVTGTAAADASSTAPVINYPTYTVGMTAYNAVPSQTDGTPDITASGAYSDPDVVAARSQDLASVLPFGAIIEVDAATSSVNCGYDKVGQIIGYRVIADTMNAKEHNKVDILMPQTFTTLSGKTANPAIILGSCKDVTIKVVGYVNISNIPKTQSELASLVDSSADLAVAK
jgi:3D (Asp-Asp-Asp) domain-containing protein